MSAPVDVLADPQKVEAARKILFDRLVALVPEQDRHFGPYLHASVLTALAGDRADARDACEAYLLVRDAAGVARVADLRADIIRAALADAKPQPVIVPAGVMTAWDRMADSIAGRRDECLERGQSVQVALYRDMLAGHHAAREAVRELIEADRELDAAEAALAEAVRPDDPQTPDEWMADSRHRDARDRVREARARRAAALARVGGAS